MPTITVKKADLERLIGHGLSLTELDAQLPMVKAELGSKDRDGASLLDADGEWRGDLENPELRVELNDTNRPDLWCAEGIARQLRDHARGQRGRYDVFHTEAASKSIEVDPALASLRPFVGGFLARGRAIDEDELLSFIESQETLCGNFGRKRKSVSIGLYDGSSLSFPVRYHAVDRHSEGFVPLPPSDDQGSEDWPADLSMTPAEILERHPTGRAYASILEGSEKVPLLSDADGRVLSFPPIINSADLGRVTPGMTELFVEVTGTELDHCLLALNILAANLVDRGWQLEPVTTRYPYATPRGQAITAPHDMSQRQSVPVSEFGRLLGEALSADEIVQKLEAYGVEAGVAEGDAGAVVTARIEPYRQDYLHPVDAIEDYAISRGYENFSPCMPEDFTVGRFHPMTELEDSLRDIMIGCGFEEAICNILTSADDIRGKMRVSEDATGGAAPFHGGAAVRIANVMNLNYSHLRDWILPSLVEIESRSSSARFPHRVFEVGEVAVHDPRANLGSRTESRLAALIADEKAHFDAAQSVLYALLGRLGLRFDIESWSHESFIEGRVALVTGVDRDGRREPLAFIGELHPELLSNWGCRVPSVAFELSVEALAQLSAP